MYEVSQRGGGRKPPFLDEREPVTEDFVGEEALVVGSYGGSAESPTSDMYSMSVDLLTTDLDLLLRPDNPMASVSAAAGPVRILQHFQATTFLTLGGPRYTSIFHSSVRGKAWERPYLMHLTLAVSSAHLKRLVPRALNPRLHQCYALAEASHWQRGLRLYRAALAARHHDSDATITATFLSIIFTFALDDALPPDSYAAADDPDKLTHALNPLAATAGFGALRALLGERILDSVWRAVLLDSDDAHGTFSTDTPGVAGLPAAFVHLCELDPSSNADNNPYHTIVRLLTPLLRLRPDGHNFTKLIAFSGRTWRAFRPLLCRRDPRALLLLAYWFALMRQVGQWWIATRAETECVAIVEYLCRVGDARITALLPFPASLGKTELGDIW